MSEKNVCGRCGCELIANADLRVCPRCRASLAFDAGESPIPKIREPWVEQGLHEAIDLVLAQYLLAHPDALPSKTSVLELLEWHATKIEKKQPRYVGSTVDDEKAPPVEAVERLVGVQLIWGAAWGANVHRKVLVPNESMIELTCVLGALVSLGLENTARLHDIYLEKRREPQPFGLTPPAYAKPKGT